MQEVIFHEHKPEVRQSYVCCLSSTNSMIYF